MWLWSIVGANLGDMVLPDLIKNTLGIQFKNIKENICYISHNNQCKVCKYTLTNGNVMTTKYGNSVNEFAVKINTYKDLNNYYGVNEDLQWNALNEINYMTYLNAIDKDLFVQLYSWREMSQYKEIGLFMESCQGNSFDYHDYVQQNSYEYITTLLHSVNVLHNHGIAHRDIKPSNIFICVHNGNRVFKLADYEYCTQENYHDTFLGTIEYASPENLQFAIPNFHNKHKWPLTKQEIIFENRGYSYYVFPSDLYSIGATFGRLFGIMDIQTFKAINRQDPNRISSRFRCYHPIFNRQWTNGPSHIKNRLLLKQLIQRLTHCNPLERLTAYNAYMFYRNTYVVE